jgi:PAS domain S-box-containing protein
MFESSHVILAILFYMAVLFAIAQFVERSARRGRNYSDNAWVYTLSMAVYCTAWTYYGSVGMAANHGMMFLTIYLGPTVSAIFWWTVLRKLVRLKNMHHVTSIADFLGARYGKSQGVAALATVMALVGVTPYIALQLKAIISSVGIITQGPGVAVSGSGHGIGLVVVGLMLVFTIVFGVRRIDPTERHQGMIMAVAVEGVVKLVAFLAVGWFVSYWLFDGLGDLMAQAAAGPIRELMTTGNSPSSSYLAWFSYMLLSMSAILFLPRQFHVAVIENFRESHIRTALWCFPLYLLLINIFVVPMAMAGLLLGHPAALADTFVLTLPLEAGQRWLSLLVFIGGFSAATSMVMISTMTLSTMVTNHLLLPAIDWLPALGFLRRHLLGCRWVAVSAGLLFGYWFARVVGESYLLVNIGIMAFAAALQFAPAMLGGLYWKVGNRAGALAGMGSGIVVWFYTMIIPAFVKSGWLASSILDQGPWGLSWLHPEHLLGLTRLDPISNAVFCSLFANAGLYILVSYLFRPGEQEQHLAGEFVEALSPGRLWGQAVGAGSFIPLEDKFERLAGILGEYFPETQTAGIMTECLDNLGIKGFTHISITKLAELNNEIESILAGSIGVAAAHAAMLRQSVFTEQEAKILAAVYGDMLAGLQVSPGELLAKIDYYQAREELLKVQARETTVKVEELEAEILRRQQVEAALQASQKNFQAIFDQTFQMIGLLDLDGRLIEVNRTALELIDAEEEAVKGSLFWETPWWADAPEEQAKIQGAVAEASLGRLVRFETTIRPWHGQILNIDFSLKTGQDTNGQAIFLIAEGRDITERKKALEEAEEARGQLLSIIDFLPDATLVVDRKKRIMAWNKAMTEMTGISQAEAVGQGEYEYAQYFYGETRPVLIDLLWETNEDNHSKYDYIKRIGQTLMAEVHLPSLYGGQGAYVWAVAAPFYDQSGALVGAIESLRDITDRRKAEQALQASERRFRELFDSITDFIYLHDLEGRLSSVNPAISSSLGYGMNEILGRPVSDFMLPEFRKAFRTDYLAELLKEGRSEGTFQLVSRPGEIVYVQYRSVVIRELGREPFVSGLGHDVSEQVLAEREVRKLRDQLFQAQKMEAIGTLAGGIAHDFNNILSAMLGYTELSMQHLDSASLPWKHMDKVLTAGSRAAELIRHILTFSRQSEHERHSLDMKPIIKESLSLLRATLPATIDIQTNITQDAGNVLADPSAIQQILMNLCTNAAHAMGDKGGVLAVSLSEINIDNTQTVRKFGLADGRYVKLSVSDSGAGIAPAIRDRIFEPYFTTKSKGEGTGLGLATTHGIVKSYGGAIEVYSEVGTGSTFNVYLPLIEDEARTAEIADRVLAGGHECILFVDDEELLVEMGREILGGLGYNVVPHTRSYEALQDFRRNPGKFDLVMTDLTMPELDGLDLASEILTLRPDLPVILCTGFSAKIVPEKARRVGIRQVLMKPLLSATLAQAVRQALDENKKRSPGP